MIEFENKLIQCRLWDEPSISDFSFKGLSFALKIYFKYSNGVILLYDITNLKSFNIIKKLNEEINKNAPPNIKKILIGTKCDLEERRQVSKEEGKKLANELCINNFFEASAKTGKNIKEAYYSLFREILRDYKENVPKILDDKNKINKKGNNCAK